MYFTFLLLLGGASLVSSLQLLPPPNFQNSNGSASFTLASIAKTIYIEEEFASRSDQNGLTLVPPTAYDFAETFRADLGAITGANWTLQRTTDGSGDSSGIYLGPFVGDTSQFTYEDDTPTEEGYGLNLRDGRVSIGGTGARGMFWGTRTLLQQIMVSNGSLPSGSISDAPAYASRGFMLDAGRKWYAPTFLKDLCTYASFFKMSEFHYHLSDNYPLSRGHNETWNEVYSQFSLMPENATLQSIVQRPNETLSRTEFEDFQSHCSARGVTVVPEIEAPGHALSITKWKPELALESKDLLNLSHRDTIPTIKGLWTEFLPWFQTKEVHIGADEYDSTLADDYINFVNEMSDFVNSTSGKRVRIWGTHEPSENFTVSNDIIVQHWQYGQSDPVALQSTGYDIVNSEDWWAYMSLKNSHEPISPAPYPQFFNETRTLNFADRNGWQWTPALFNPVNTSVQPEDGAKGLKGATMAAWNDNGPDATTQLEAYYAMRRGFALVGARAWSGSRGPRIDDSTVDLSIDFYSVRAPGQNLDRVLPVPTNSSGPLVSWTTSSMSNETVNLSYGSKGMNYTLSLLVDGPFSLSGPDNTLSLSSDGSLAFTADGWEYPLRSTSEGDEFTNGEPGRIWANQSTSTHELVTVPVPANITISTDVLGGSRVWINGTYTGRFEVFVFGGHNTLFSWSQMAFVAPLDKLQGGVQSLILNDGAMPTASGSNSYGGLQANAAPQIRCSSFFAQMFILLAFWSVVSSPLW